MSQGVIGAGPCRSSRAPRGHRRIGLFGESGGVEQDGLTDGFNFEVEEGCWEARDAEELLVVGIGGLTLDVGVKQGLVNAEGIPLFVAPGKELGVHLLTGVLRGREEGEVGVAGRGRGGMRVGPS